MLKKTIVSPLAKLQVALFVMLLSGCEGYQHMAAPQYVGANEKKGDISVQVSTKTAMVGISLTDQINVFGTAHYSHRSDSSLVSFSNKENSGEDAYSSDITQGSLGIGYFAKDYYIGNVFKERLGDSLNSDGVLFIRGIQGSIGYGNLLYAHSKLSYQYGEYLTKAKNYSLFFQPIMGFKCNWLFFAVSPTLEFKHYFDIRSEAIAKGTYAMFEPDNWDQTFLKQNAVNCLFFEPCLIGRIGTKNIKWQTQLTRSYNLSKEHIHMKDGYFIYLSLSINLNLITGF